MSTAVRVERNKAATLEQSFYVDGVLTSATGAVPITITRADGTVLVSGAATTNPSPGIYRYALAPQPELDYLTAVWTGAWSGQVQSETTYVEVVGDFYVALGELRAMPDLSSTVKFPNAKLIAARHWFESTFEDYTKVAEVPRIAIERISGRGRTTLRLGHLFPRTLLSVNTGVAFTAAQLADVVLYDHGEAARLTLGYWPVGNRNITFIYTHGLDGPRADVKEAALMAIRDRLLDPDPSRQFSVATQEGIVRNSTPGPDSPFGIQFVDEVARRRSHRAPAIL